MCDEMPGSHPNCSSICCQTEFDSFGFGAEGLQREPFFRCDALVQGGAEKNPDPSHFDTFQREERVSYS